jgi:hypothetical protein
MMNASAGRRHARVRAVAAAVVLLWVAAPAWAGGCEPKAPVTLTASNGQVFRWDPGYG